MLRIISHNINGLQSYVSSGKMLRLMNMEPDVICLQEVKCQELEKVKFLLHPWLDEWILAMQPSDFKKGYAGVMTMVRKNHAASLLESIDYPESSTTILENMSGYAEGRIVTLKFDSFYLVNVYVINSGSGKSADRMAFDNKLMSYLLSLNDRPVIVCGDMNVCATKYDYWNDYHKAINTYPGLMQFEIDDFNELCFTCKLKDPWRDINPEGRRYTWCSPRSKDHKKGWRLDYFLCQDGINIKRANIYQGWNESGDHSPISLDIDV